MNPNAQAWVAALRSGEYRQTTGHLRDKYGYCCLGVACEVAIDHGVPVKVSAAADQGVPCWTFDGQVAWLPLAVQDWLGLSDTDGGFDGGDFNTPCSLSEANDAGLTFEQIADLIESQPQGLFRPDEEDA